MMHYPTAFPFFLKYLTNAEYMASSSSVTLKSTLMISSNHLDTELTLAMLDKTFYVVDKSDIHRGLLQSVLSPFLSIGTILAPFHC
jgi:hypothetical protein